MRRYPGVQPFRLEDESIFFGRKSEIEELFRLILLYDIVVLFGKSGTGKSSILRAGLSPLLHGRLVHPVFIRLNGLSQDQTLMLPKEQVYQTLLQEGYIPSTMPPDLTLWEYLHAFSYNFAGEACLPLLVFDQFEELFTLYDERDRSRLNA